jgi:Icc-related predicted phosphoesterase
MKITFVSDTHTKHNKVAPLLPGGDLLIHAGDFMNSGYHYREAWEFVEWFDSIKNYDHVVFIAGNHDRLFEDWPEKASEITNSFKHATYLQDSWVHVGSDMDSLIKIYGSPWQPEFYDWAFNLPRNGEDLREKWFWIPNDTDILITHGPPQTKLDTSGTPWNTPLLGCELLMERVKELKPKIHVFGHIHGGYGYVFDGNTHYFNASVLNERYEIANKPMTIDWNPKTNEVVFL